MASGWSSRRATPSAKPLVSTPPASLASGFLSWVDGEWDIPQLRSLIRATLGGSAEIKAYEIDLKRREDARRLVINLRKPDYGQPDHVRLVMAGSMSPKRAAEKLKDTLLKDNAKLLREVQHRIANSLQVIASVLLQACARCSPKKPALI